MWSGACRNVNNSTMAIINEYILGSEDQKANPATVGHHYNKETSSDHSLSYFRVCLLPSSIVMKDSESFVTLDNTFNVVDFSSLCVIHLGFLFHSA